MYAQCIQSNFVSKYKVSWDVLMAVTLSGSHILQRGRTSLFSLMFFISFFPTNDNGENFSFFVRYNYVLGILLLHETRCNGQVQGRPA